MSRVGDAGEWAPGHDGDQCGTVAQVWLVLSDPPAVRVGIQRCGKATEVNAATAADDEPPCVVVGVADVGGEA